MPSTGVDVVAVVLMALLCVYVPLTRAQAPGLSIDCGINTASYPDPNYNFTWVPDEPYISTGQNYDLPSLSSIRPLQSLRYFQGNQTKYCYVLPATLNQTYLVRAMFLYTDFLGNGIFPSFNLEIETENVATLNFQQLNNQTIEIYLFTTSNNIYVCLAPTSPTDVPFISSLELRLLDTATMYTVVQTGVYLSNKYHIYLGNLTQRLIRYPDDKYDRLWQPANSVGFSSDLLLAADNSTTHPVNVSGTMVPDMVPEILMQNVAYWTQDPTDQFTSGVGLGQVPVPCYLAFYFADIDPGAGNGSRVFDLVINGQLSLGQPNISVVNLAQGLYRAYEIQKPKVMLNDSSIFALLSHPDSALGPILNALELFTLTGTVGLRTFAADALAIESIKQYFNLTSWTGDPCVVTSYNWTKCTSDPSPRITAVTLSNLNLTGSIPEGLSNLTALETLSLDHNFLAGTIPESFSALINLQSLRLQDNEITGSIPTSLTSLKNLTELRLDHNSLTGPIPVSLSALTGLQSLDLSDNNLTGIIPSGLLQDRNLTYFNYSGNQYLCAGPNPCSSSSPVPTPGPKHVNKTNVPAIIGGTIGGLLVVTAIILVLIWFRVCYQVQIPPGNTGSEDALMIVKGIEQPQVAEKYSLAEIIAATNDFDRLLGEGGFARVYYGKLLDGREVAVKRMTLNSSGEEDSQFFNEVHLLSTVHHKNLVSLIGYCQESNEQILIYEYMANGTIRESLYGTAKAVSNPLDWKTRLNMALNAAQGLEYLHTGCPRPIIHRDVKTSNILLSRKNVAKVADFGLSKMTMEEGASHISTMVKGTAGYLDPEYFTKQQLTDKSDVFSFGIVLLELICGRPPINRLLHNEREWNIGEWVRPFLQSGDIYAIIDKALNNEFNIESVWKVAETAMLSIEPYNTNRPTMEEVVHDIKEAIEIEENVRSYDVSSQMFNNSSSQRSPGVLLGLAKVDSNSQTPSSDMSKSSIFGR